MRRLFPIFLCLTLLLSGCVQELVSRGDRSIAISVVCSDAELVDTKADTKPGEDSYRENRIESIDYFFYTLAESDVTGDEPASYKPAATASACYHKRVTDTWTYSGEPHTYNMIVSLDQLNTVFFPETDYVYVLAIANYKGNELGLLSLKELSELEYSTDFAKMKVDNQDAFLMSGSAVLHLDSRDIYEVNKVSRHSIDLERHAAKFTVSLNIPKNGISLEGGTWKPMLQGMEVFLCNGVNTVRLDGSMDPDPTYFNYKRLSRPFKGRDSQAANSPVNYYDTDPMYSYPHAWTCGIEETTSTEAEPYLKIIVPWYREEVSNGQTISVTFAQRQCYYKVMLPSSKDGNDFKGQLERNSWYHFDVDITILGAMTDEDAVKIEGTCFIGKWQNSDAISHLAEVGTARYLNVENEYIEIHNIENAKIYYVSSHPVQIIDKSTFVEGEYSIDSVRATRLYYGKTKGTAAGVKLNDTTCIRLVVNDNDRYPINSQYLEYTTAERWLTLKSDDQKTYVYLNHKLNNDYTNKNFDYSPYLITFTLKHKDRKAGEGIEKMVTIVQYPAIYIDCIPNSDRSYKATAREAAEEHKTFFYAESNAAIRNGNTPTSTYWGYVFVDGGAYLPDNDDGSFNNNTTYKFVNSVNHTVKNPGVSAEKWEYVDTESSGTPEDPKYNARQWRRGLSTDIFFHLTNDEKREYQWRAVWYTGGTFDIYRINVSVLSDNKFVIGDPRSTEPNDLHYQFAGGPKLPARNGFAEAPALYGESPRSLKYYYPTEATARTEHMLAPSYRVSSKFSGVEYGGSGSGYIGDVKKEFAEYRCAAYQEDGFPAGRWRLPTKGEIHFIAQLSANGVFYTLFNDGSTYWSANGPVKISGNSVLDANTNTALLRCVYDSWYWGSDQSEYDAWRQTPAGGNGDPSSPEFRNRFVWGDKPREQ